MRLTQGPFSHPSDLTPSGRRDGSNGARSDGADALPVSTLALSLLAATQTAAVACGGWVGRGEPKAADAAAVAAMRSTLGRLPGRGRVVIGEGEKDDAPMLFAGEEMGTGEGPACDLAVDPLEGTRLCAAGGQGAVSVVAAGPEGSLWATPGWYMEKLVVGASAAGAVSLEQTVEENLEAVAAVLGRSVPELAVAIQDRPRHAELIAKVRKAGAAVVPFGDGDVMTSLRILLPGGDLDLLIGVGGAPEGVIMACAARLLGGDMQGRLAPQSAEERTRLVAAGAPVGDVLTLDELATAEDCVFVATGVTTGPLLRGPKRTTAGWSTSSLLATPDHPGLLIEGPIDSRRPSRKEETACTTS